MTDRTGNLLGALSLVISDQLRAATAAEIGESGMAAASLVLLTNLHGPNIETVANALGLSHSGTVRLIDRLAANRLVVRRQGPDARSVAIFLTGGGRRKADRILAARGQVIQNHLASLTESERTQLTKVLERVLSSAKVTPSNVWRICRLCDVETCTDPFCPTLEAMKRGRSANSKPTISRKTPSPRG